MVARPRSTSSFDTSRPTVSKPACTQTWAIPAPIVPRPTPPTLRISTPAILLLLVAEADLDALLGPPLLDLRPLAQSPFVGLRARRGREEREAPRPEPARPDDVRLRGEQRDVRAEVDPHQEADDEREGAIDVACTFQLVGDVIRAARLRSGPQHRRDRRTHPQLVPGDVPVGQDPERHEEEPEVERDREDDADHLEAGAVRASVCPSAGKHRGEN